MSKKSIAEWFAEKATPVEALLGKAQDKVVFDTIKNRHYQLFEHGVIIGKVIDVTKLSHLTCTYGKLFSAWWGNPGADWLGEPTSRGILPQRSGLRGTKSWSSASSAA